LSAAASVHGRWLEGERANITPMAERSERAAGNGRLMIETDRHRITGTVTAAKDGSRSRISEMLNTSERDFIALTDVTIEPLDGRPELRCEFLVVARSKIVFALPLSD
jgi:hypothetical protein